MTIGEELPKTSKIDDLKKNYYFVCNMLKKEIPNKLEYFMAIKDYNNFESVISNKFLFERVLREVANEQAKKRRAYKKIEIAERDADNNERKLIFGTLTFNDKAFFKGDIKSPIKEETRTKNVNKWLNEIFDYVIVNIDYGKQNEREHHHFLGVMKEEYENKLEIVKHKGKLVKSKTGHQLYRLNEDTWKYGFEPTFEIVRIREERKITNYLTKVVNHNRKSTTKNRRFRVLGQYKNIYQDIDLYHDYLKYKNKKNAS